MTDEAARRSLADRRLDDGDPVRRRDAVVAQRHRRPGRVPGPASLASQSAAAGR